MYSLAPLSQLHSLSHASSAPSLKLFLEVINQQQGDSFCLLTKPYLHHYHCYIHFPMLLTDFHCFCHHSSDTYHPWFPSDFCDAKRSSSSFALPSFYFVSCIEFYRFYHSHCNFPADKFLQYKNNHIVSNTVIIRLRFSFTLV